ncbi:unnamed protein product [Urochloa humidicola]
MGKKKAAKKSNKRPRLAAASEEAEQQLLAGEEDPGDDLDLISRLTDDLLLEIIKLLPAADGCRTQILSKRWSPLWPSQWPNYKATITPSEDQDRAAAILSVHPGPIRCFSLRWCRSAFKHHPDS